MSKMNLGGWRTQLGVPHSIAHLAIEWGRDATDDFPNVSRFLGLIFSSHS
jgi:hypothetical protein